MDILIRSKIVFTLPFGIQQCRSYFPTFEIILQAWSLWLFSSSAKNLSIIFFSPKKSLWVISSLSSQGFFSDNSKNNGLTIAASKQWLSALNYWSFCDVQKIVHEMDTVSTFWLIFASLNFFPVGKKWKIVLCTGHFIFLLSHCNGERYFLRAVSIFFTSRLVIITTNPVNFKLGINLRK